MKIYLLIIKSVQKAVNICEQKKRPLMTTGNSDHKRKGEDKCTDDGQIL